MSVPKDFISTVNEIFGADGSSATDAVQRINTEVNEHYARLNEPLFGGNSASDNGPHFYNTPPVMAE